MVLLFCYFITAFYCTTRLQCFDRFLLLFVFIDVFLFTIFVASVA